MNDMENQSLMSILLPPEGVDGVGRFLNMVGRALACRSDAELAREMGVSASSVANWRRRGAVSEAGKNWFCHEMIFAVATPRTSEVVLNDVAANTVLISLLLETEGNPLGKIGSDQSFSNAMALPGLVQLIILIGALMRTHGHGYEGGLGDENYLKLCREALAVFRRAPIFGH